MIFLKRLSYQRSWTYIQKDGKIKAGQERLILKIHFACEVKSEKSVGAKLFEMTSSYC